jgi:hypothetical protein
LASRFLGGIEEYGTACLKALDLENIDIDDSKAVNIDKSFFLQQLEI